MYYIYGSVRAIPTYGVYRLYDMKDSIAYIHCHHKAHETSGKTFQKNSGMTGAGGNGEIGKRNGNCRQHLQRMVLQACAVLALCIKMDGESLLLVSCVFVCFDAHFSSISIYKSIFNPYFQFPIIISSSSGDSRMQLQGIYCTAGKSLSLHYYRVKSNGKTTIHLCQCL